MDHHSYLSVELQSHLKLNYHIAKIISKANRSLGFLRRNISNCPEAVKERAYQALVRPHLKYLSVENIQRQAARFVKSDYTRENGTVTRLLDSLNWPSLQARRKCRRLELFYESLHGSAVLPIPSHSNVATHTYNNRSQASFVNPSSKGNIYVNNFFPWSIKDWNALPLDTRKIETLDIF